MQNVQQNKYSETWSISLQNISNTLVMTFGLLISFHVSIITEISFISEHTQDSKAFSRNPVNSLPFFPDKIPLDLNHCPVQTSVSIGWPPSVNDLSSINEAGIEVDFIMALQKQIRCNISFLPGSMADLGFNPRENGENFGRIAMLKVSSF